jgi:hypothetical protein
MTTKLNHPDRIGTYCIVQLICAVALGIALTFLAFISDDFHIRHDTALFYTSYVVTFYGYGIGLLYIVFSIPLLVTSFSKGSWHNMAFLLITCIIMYFASDYARVSLLKLRNNSFRSVTSQDRIDDCNRNDNITSGSIQTA